MLVILAISLCSCTSKRVSVEQSMENFEIYKNSLQQIADRYEVDLIETENAGTKSQSAYKAFSVTINTDADIQVELFNSLETSAKEFEEFCITYTVKNKEVGKSFNVDLFVDMVNCVSGKTITNDFCSEFLAAPESKYAAEKYGYQKSADELIAKKYPLNFMEDWSISYFLNNQNEESLCFSGITKQSTGISEEK